MTGCIAETLDSEMILQKWHFFEASCANAECTDDLENGEFVQCPAGARTILKLVQSTLQASKYGGSDCTDDLEARAVGLSVHVPVSIDTGLHETRRSNRTNTAERTTT